MAIDGALEAIKRLQGFYGKKLSPEALEFYLQDCRMAADNVLNAAVTYCLRTERTFPTPTVLKNYVVEARREMERAEHSGSVVRSFAGFARENRGDPECIKESKRLLARIALPAGDPMHLSGDMLVAEMRVMENAFAGRGWGKCASELEEDLRKSRAARREVGEEG